MWALADKAAPGARPRRASKGALGGRLDLLPRALLRAVPPLGLPSTAARALLALATAQGLCGLAKHLWHLVCALSTCWSRHFLWAAPLQVWQLIWTAALVSWRRLRGTPRSHRWSAPVEFFVEGVRPRQAFRNQWEGVITPAIRLLTHLDCHMETIARIFHPGVRFEWHSQGCPRPMTWVWFPEEAAALRDEGSGSDSGGPGAAPPELVVLFLHGGGYWAFTGKSHLEYVARVVKELHRGVPCRVKACVVDTRRAPEHLWPAPVEDAVACYDWLQQGCGYKASQIVLAGDSAGGGLCLCLLLALRDAGKELPLCATVVSPLTDLSRTEDEYPRPEALQTDFLPAAAAVVSGQYYIAPGEDTRHPLISPKYGELHALPPVLVQAGEGELLARDSVEYARRLEAYGGSVKLEMYPDMPHIFPMLACLGLGDARTAIRRQAKFVRRVLRRGSSPKTPGRRLLRILVHDGRTQSFEDMQRTLSSCGGNPQRLASSSSPVLDSLGEQTGKCLREALFPPEFA